MHVILILHHDHQIRHPLSPIKEGEAKVIVKVSSLLYFSKLKAFLALTFVPNATKFGAEVNGLQERTAPLSSICFKSDIVRK